MSLNQSHTSNMNKENDGQALLDLEYVSRNGDRELEKEMKETLANIEKELETKVGTKAQLEAFEKECRERMKEARATYRSKVDEKIQILWDKVKEIVNKQNGVSGNPKVEACWNKAWEHGHANGYREVVACFENLVDLIK